MKTYVIFSNHALGITLRTLFPNSLVFKTASGSPCTRSTDNSRLFTLMKEYVKIPFSHSYTFSTDDLTPLILGKLSGKISFCKILEVADESKFRAFRLCSGLWVTDSMRTGDIDADIDWIKKRCEFNNFSYSEEEIKNYLKIWLAHYSLDLEKNNPEGRGRSKDYLRLMMEKMIESVFMELNG